jgi:hypothetical protein
MTIWSSTEHILFDIDCTARMPSERAGNQRNFRIRYANSQNNDIATTKIQQQPSKKPASIVQRRRNTTRFGGTASRCLDPNLLSTSCLYKLGLTNEIERYDVLLESDDCLVWMSARDTGDNKTPPNRVLEAIFCPSDAELAKPGAWRHAEGCITVKNNHLRSTEFTRAIPVQQFARTVRGTYTNGCPSEKLAARYQLKPLAQQLICPEIKIFCKPI